ncbi:MAG: chloride channel protein [Bacteroidales bacterium]|nr:chloride channel protein [Bacteroidales bacterium]
MIKSIINRILYFKQKYLTDKQFVFILSIVTGLIAGLLAVSMKNLVHYLQYLIFNYDFQKLTLSVTPIIGIIITIILAKRVFKVKTGHGIPKVLYAISRKNGALGRKSLLSSGLLSVITVGFGGSAGLEGPSASAGATIGSLTGRSFQLEFKQLIILIGCGSSAAIAAIFNTPIAAILFSLEILMLDLTISSIIPLLISSITGLAVSYFFLGRAAIYSLPGLLDYNMNQIPIFIILGIIAGLNAAIFSKIYLSTERIFKNFGSIYKRIIIGGIILFGLFYFFPATWGEGYEIINRCIANDSGFINDTFIFTDYYREIQLIVLLFLTFIIKTLVTNITFGIGGVGGIFAPSLFLGAVTGLMASRILILLGFTEIHTAVIVLVAMSGFMTGILHAPLTGIFLVVEITNGHGLIVPLIITSIIAYLISKKIIKHSVYNFELAERNLLFTHDKNRSILAKIDLRAIIEKDFQTLLPDDTILMLIEKIKKTKRNVFPVVDSENFLIGIITLEDAKKYIFKPKHFKI